MSNKKGKTRIRKNEMKRNILSSRNLTLSRGHHDCDFWHCAKFLHSSQHNFLITGLVMCKCNNILFSWCVIFVQCNAMITKVRILEIEFTKGERKCHPQNVLLLSYSYKQGQVSLMEVLLDFEGLEIICWLSDGRKTFLWNKMWVKHFYDL